MDFSEVVFCVNYANASIFIKWFDAMNWLFWRLFNADFLLAAQAREGLRVCKYNKCHVTQININKIQVKSCNVRCIISMNLWCTANLSCTVNSGMVSLDS